ncbi:MAG: hypothetical protein IKP66_04680, partial [Lachnospiraceae bacterium]|nr:hypothetical protein [Lachnospiraceae bacterium]
EVYCYTFGAPKNHKGNKNTYQNNIKNIINEDDFFIKPLIEEKEYYRKGVEYNKSIKYDLLNEYRKLVGVPSSSYKGDVTKANTVAKQIRREKDGLESVRDILIKSLTENTGVGQSRINISPTTTKINETTVKINENNYAFKDANSVKAYYTLSKCLDGYDIKRKEEEKYNKVEEKVSSERNRVDTKTGYYYNKVVENALQNIGRWYVENVYTYQAGNGKSGEAWKTEFYSNIETKKKRGGTTALQRRIENRDRYNATVTEIENYFLDDNETIQMRSNYNDYYVKNNAEVYKWIEGYSRHGRYTTDELNKSIGSEFNEFGDDCSSFTMAVLDYVTKGALYDKVKADKKISMYNAGSGNIIDDNKNYKSIIRDLHFEYIPVTTEMTMDDLENGDLLIANGDHYEFIIVGQDKSGTIGDRQRTFKQFGWGNVKGVYPDNNFNITKSANETFYDQNIVNTPRRMYSYIIRLNNEGIRLYE